MNLRFVRQLLLLSLWLSAPVSIVAQEPKNVQLKVEARGEYDYESISGATIYENTGLRGNVIDFKLEGNISRHFSYKYRQRLNTLSKDPSFFDATDWLYLNYAPDQHWNIMAGKWVVINGSWEFDPPPIDCFQLCEFAYNYACYQWGGLVSYTTKNKKNTFMLQATQSPFRKGYEATSGEGAQLFAYGLIWTGQYGVWKPLWTLNLVERTPGHFLNFVGIGNRFNFGKHVEWDIDLLHRAGENQRYLFKDFSLMSRFNYRFSPLFSAFAKVSYDVNHSGTNCDLIVHNGTEITRIGTGFEFFPLKSDLVRLHANYSYSFGRNTNPDGYLKDRQSLVSIGISWQMKVL